MNLTRRIVPYVLCITMITGLSACSKNSGNISKPDYPKSISSDDYDRLIEIREKNKLDESFVKGLNNFTFESASKLLSSSTKNVSYSPTSLYMALSIVGIGAGSTNQEEIFSVLGTGGKGTDYVAEQNCKLFNLLYTDNEIIKLKIANSLWLQKGMSFKSEFTDKASKYLYASLYSVNFADKKTSKLMSNWISENTKGVLSPQIETDKEQIMSIFNTIYFKDEWIDRFNEEETKPDTFYLSDGSKIKCDFMNSTYVTHGFYRGEGFTASSLSLKNDGDMIFVLPDKGVSIDSLLSTPGKTAGLFNNENSVMGKVIFQIPKFSYGNSLELRDTLESMGMKAAFKNNADFSGITDGTAFISNIKQQSHVAIDEKGVEAAAFTEIHYSGSAPPKDEIAEMILNRPFIYAIRFKGSVIFIGVVNNPAEK